MNDIIVTGGYESIIDIEINFVWAPIIIITQVTPKGTEIEVKAVLW